MAKKESIHDMSVTDISDPTGKSFIFLNRPVTLALFVFSILALLFSLLIYQRYELKKETKKKETLGIVHNAKEKLQETLEHGLSAVKILTFFIDHNGHVNNFDSAASEILNTVNDIDALQLVPDGVIKYVYPLKGNEKVIGYNILIDSVRNKEAIKAIKKGKLFFSGPFELKQGGIGVVGRLPVFRKEKFWGFSSVIIKLPTLLNAAGIDTTGESGYRFQLSKINPDTKKEEFFIRQEKEPSSDYTISVSVSDSDWKLSVEPLVGAEGLANIYILAIIGFLFSVFGSIFVYTVASRPQKLSELITERTKQLSESEIKFSKAFNSDLIGFAISDVDFRIVDVNDTYATILGSPRDTLIGKTSDEAGIMSKINAEKRADIDQQIEQTLKEQGGLHNFEIEFERQHGEFANVLLSIEKIEFNNKPHWLTSAVDITANKKSAAYLRESEKRYQQIVETAQEGIWMIDDNNITTFVNNRMAQILGYTKEEMIGMQLNDFMNDEGREIAAVNIQKRKNGIHEHHDFAFQRKDGGTIWTLMETTPVFNDGKYTGALAMVMDITERKKTDIALRESEERYRILVENATEALVVLDGEKQNFLSVSESATKLFRMPKEELLKKGPATVSPEFQPDGRLSSTVATENIQKAIRGEKPVFEWTHCDKEGNLIPCEIWLVRLPSEKGILVRGTIIDITERKKVSEKLYQSEQKYRLLFYNNPLPMWMATIPSLDIIDVNESAIKQYGYNREEFLQLNARDMRPVEDVENFVKEVNAMESGITNTRAWRHKKKDGTIIHVEIYSHEIIYEGKRVWLGLSSDVTEKYIAKELLQKSYEDIRQFATKLQNIREDERTNIAREIHDELGQQLTGLKMDLHWLTQKIKSEDEEVNNKMKESIQLINATITTVRKIATDLRPSILDDLGLLTALEWQGEEFEKRSGTKVKFINEVGDINLQPEVATAIFRIYQELLTNIARHANATQVTVLLHTDSNRFYFSITDNGSGFDLDTINSKKTLGLLGIKERTLILGGTYDFKSTPGKGSETIISIPLDLI